MTLRQTCTAVALIALDSAPVHAADRVLAADGQWHAFAVDSVLADRAAPLGWIDEAGVPLSFTLTVPSGATSVLTVVDGVFAGDVFSLNNFGNPLGSTSAVAPGSFENAVDVGLDFDSALANPAFSRGTFVLAGGNYRISGLLTQSVTFAGEPIDATAGALRLSIAAIPEPDISALFIAGLGALGFIARRRSHRLHHPRTPCP